MRDGLLVETYEYAFEDKVAVIPTLFPAISRLMHKGIAYDE